MGCGLRWCAEFRQEGGGHVAFLLTQWMHKSLVGFRSPLAARATADEGVNDVRCPPGGGATACMGDNVETNPAARNIAQWKPINPMCGPGLAQIRHHGPGAENHGQHAAGGGFCASPDSARCGPACRRPPGGGRPGPRRGWPRTGHSVPEASMHFAGVACRALVLSALRLRVHECFGNGVRPRRSAPGPKRSARRPKDGRWPAWAGRPTRRWQGWPDDCAIRCCLALRPQQGA